MRARPVRLSPRQCTSTARCPGTRHQPTNHPPTHNHPHRPLIPPHPPPPTRQRIVGLAPVLQVHVDGSQVVPGLPILGLQLAAAREGLQRLGIVLGLDAAVAQATRGEMGRGCGAKDCLAVTNGQRRGEKRATRRGQRTCRLLLERSSSAPTTPCLPPRPTPPQPHDHAQPDPPSWPPPHPHTHLNQPSPCSGLSASAASQCSAALGYCSRRSALRASER